MTGRIRLGVAVLACCLFIGVGVVTPALAGDGSTTFTADPDELDVDPGEEFELDVVVSDHGDLQGNGIDTLEFDLEYETALLTATDVEHGSMLAAGDDATVDGTDEIDAEAGIVSIDQEREPSGDGARGTETAATITFEVDQDADPATTTIEIANASAMLVTDFPQGAFERDTTVHIDGGGDEDEDRDEPEGVTLAEDDDGAGEAGETDDSDDSETDGSDDDSIPGFAVPVAIGAVGAFVWYRLARS